MSIRPFLALTALAAAVAACAPVPPGGGYGPPPTAAVFNPQDFAWSTRSG